MRRSLRADLAAAVAIAGFGGGTVAADPSTPQLSPLHRQREDAQRLNQQHHGLDRAPSREAAPGPLPTPPASGSGSRHTTRGAGLALMGAAGVSAIIALPLLSFDNPGSDGMASDNSSIGKLLLATSAVTGVLGLVLLLSDRSVAVGPAVSSSGAGIAIMGRM